MKPQFQLLSTPLFLLGLMVLLLNDFILKEVYNNYLTGKLSDFAGLFIFPIFWIALLPKHKKTIFWLTAIGFLFWKTPYSQGLIDGWNSMTGLHYNRIVDYWDYIALIVLPFSYWYSDRMPVNFSFKLSPFFPLLIASFAFLATSDDHDYQPTSFLEIEESFEVPLSRDRIIDRVEEIDSLMIRYGLPLQHVERDTLSLEYFSPACNNWISSLIELVAVSADTSIIQLFIVEYCHEDESKKGEVINEFKVEIIDIL